MCDLACIRSVVRCNSQSRAIKDNVHVSDNKFVSIGLHGMLVYTESKWYLSISPCSNLTKIAHQLHIQFNLHPTTLPCHVVSALHYTGASWTERSKEYDGSKSLQKWWVDKAPCHGPILYDEHCDGHNVDMQPEGKVSATHVDCRR